MCVVAGVCAGDFVVLGWCGVVCGDFGVVESFVLWLSGCLCFWWSFSLVCFVDCVPRLFGVIVGSDKSGCGCSGVRRGAGEWCAVGGASVLCGWGVRGGGGGGVVVGCGGVRLQSAVRWVVVVAWWAVWPRCRRWWWVVWRCGRVGVCGLCEAEALVSVGVGHVVVPRVLLACCGLGMVGKLVVAGVVVLVLAVVGVPRLS